MPPKLAKLGTEDSYFGKTEMPTITEEAHSHQAAAENRDEDSAVAQASPSKTDASKHAAPAKVATRAVARPFEMPI